MNTPLYLALLIWPPIITFSFSMSKQYAPDLLKSSLCFWKPPKLFSQEVLSIDLALKGGPLTFPSFFVKLIIFISPISRGTSSMSYPLLWTTNMTKSSPPYPICMNLAAFKSIFRLVLKMSGSLFVTSLLHLPIAYAITVMYIKRDMVPPMRLLNRSRPWNWSCRGWPKLSSFLNMFILN